ncbi:3195_t:CDS:2, partial [Cetraspora pellucida]
KLMQNNKNNLLEVILFGLDLQCLESCQKNEYYKKNFLYLRSEAQQNSHLKEFALDLDSYSRTLFEKYNFTDTTLDCLELNISNKLVKIKFTESNNKLVSLTHLDASIYACNKGLISRDSYRYLAAIQPSLESGFSTTYSTMKKSEDTLNINKTQLGNSAV